MNVHIALYGALREADATGFVELELPAGSTVGSLREKLVAHLAKHAPGVSGSLLARSAFATDAEILHDHREVPEGVGLALLPPVSGG